MQKGQVLIFLIVGIVVVIGGYLFYTNYSNNRTKIVPNPVVTSQTPQPTPIPPPSHVPSTTTTVNKTDGNGTYTDIEAGFTFKYPIKWKESDMSNINFGSPILSATQLRQPPPFQTTDEIYNEIRVAVYKNVNKLTTDEFVKKEVFKEEQDKNFDYGNYKKGIPYDFNNIHAIKIAQVMAPTGLRGPEVFISHGSYIISLSTTSSSETNAKILVRFFPLLNFSNLDCHAPSGLAMTGEVKLPNLYHDTLLKLYL